MIYFKECTTLTELKTLYRSLAMTNHPDKGGDLEVMKAINIEYEKVIKILAAGGGFTAEEADAEILNAHQYKDAINAIINLEGITIELCGGWIWVSGNTKQYKEILKAHKFWFASKKVMWYFRAPEYKTSNSKPKTMDQIRGRYGSQSLKNMASFRNLEN